MLKSALKRFSPALVALFLLEGLFLGFSFYLGVRMHMDANSALQTLYWSDIIQGLNEMFTVVACCLFLVFGRQMLKIRPPRLLQEMIMTLIFASVMIISIHAFLPAMLAGRLFMVLVFACSLTSIIIAKTIRRTLF